MIIPNKRAALIRIGTRGSKLALAQAEELRIRLIESNDILKEPYAIEIVVINTTGDTEIHRRLADIGGKGLFVKEIEEALLDRRVDVALHSMKDVETTLTPGTEISCILPREDVRDAFLSHRSDHLKSLPAGAIVGTSSVRRAAFIKNQRPDLQTMLFRGNIDTRIAKLDSGHVDATLLAVAGLKRLGLQDRISRLLNLDEMPPAVGQGAIGAQCRTGRSREDINLRNWLEKINHLSSAICVETERAMLKSLDGSCQTPIAGHAELSRDGGIKLIGYLLSEDGTHCYKAEESGVAADNLIVGDVVGQRLLSAFNAHSA